MTFFHPLWLSALLPWAVLCAQLLRRGIARSIAVPFLALWPTEASALVASPRKKSLPSVSILLLLMALLLSIVAAAGPGRDGAMDTVTIIIDRGLTMSVRGDVDALLDAADRQVRAKHVRLVLVPGETIDSDDRGWRPLAGHAGPSAVDTAAAVRQATLAAQVGGNAPIIVISDVQVPRDARTKLLSPGSMLVNVGIATFAISDGVYPQAMVRVRNRSTARSGYLKVLGGAKPVTQKIDLPPGDDRDFFIDLPPPLAETIGVELSADHTSPVNDRAWAVRTSTGPVRWSTVGAVPEAVKKFVDVYDRLRPATKAELSLVQTGAGGDGVWLAPVRSNGEPGETAVIADRLTADIRAWPAAADVDAAAPPGWRVLVRRGSCALLAERPDGHGVWVNLDVDSWSTSPDFVVFFANVFDAMADNESRWTSELPYSPFEAPGVYAAASGRIAINAPPLPARAEVASDFIGHFNAQTAGSTPIGHWLIAIATLLCAGGVMLGTTRRSRRVETAPLQMGRT